MGPGSIGSTQGMRKVRFDGWLRINLPVKTKSVWPLSTSVLCKAHIGLLLLPISCGLSGPFAQAPDLLKALNTGQVRMAPRWRVSQLALTCTMASVLLHLGAPPTLSQTWIPSVCQEGFCGVEGRSRRQPG